MIEDNIERMSVSSDFEDDDDVHINTGDGLDGMIAFRPQQAVLNEQHIGVNEHTRLLHASHASSRDEQSTGHEDSNHSDNTNNNQGISWYFAVFLIVNAALGAGLLNFSKAFDNAGGILVSTIVHLVNMFGYCCLL